jgi:RTX calcium-binding nonapeptide repeat (4 copies)/Concanavalin A-like lectin/glucanases superfamily
MTPMVSGNEIGLLEDSAKDFGTGVINLGHNESLFPRDSFTLSSTFELYSVYGGLQAVLWSRKHYGIFIKNNDLLVSLHGEDDKLHTIIVRDVFEEPGWHDVQVVLDTDSSRLEFWVDGANIYSASGEWISLTSTMRYDVSAGGRSNGRNVLDGQISSVSVVNEALSIDSSQSLYDRMVSVSGEKPVIEQLDFEENLAEETFGESEVLVTEEKNLETDSLLVSGNAENEKSGSQFSEESDDTGDLSIDVSGNSAVSEMDQIDEIVSRETIDDVNSFTDSPSGNTDADGQITNESVVAHEEYVPISSDKSDADNIVSIGMTNMDIGTGGVPVDLAITRDYDQIFSQLSDAGINVYFPVTIYEEIPEVKALHFEADFFPPPFGSATDEIYDLARHYGIKIAFSADLMYPVGTDLPIGNADPLQAIISSGGRDIIHSVFNYDEPILNGLDPAYSQSVYEHVKLVDPTIMVHQVHQPVGNEADPSEYLQSVLMHAEWADTVGFDVYPIMTHPGIQSPYSSGQIVSPVEALKGYVSWLDTHLPDKGHMMVLQAFELADLYSDEYFATLLPADAAMSRAPTEIELKEMVYAVSDVDSIFWFGASFRASQSDELWQSVLSTSKVTADGTLGTLMEEVYPVSSNTNLTLEDTDDGMLVEDHGAVNDAEGILLVSDGIFEDEESSVQFSEIKAIYGTEVSDALLGSEQADDIIAYKGDDFIGAMGGNDRISGGDGNDVIYGGFGNDEIFGGSGADIFTGESGNDMLWGENGDDYIEGGSGNDIISGGEGQDQLVGGEGADTITGSLGDDALMGGEGSDTFVFALGDGDDFIVDFTVGQDSLLFLSGEPMSELSLTEISGHTRIEFGPDSVTLLGVGESQWNDIDIVFG